MQWGWLAVLHIYLYRKKVSIIAVECTTQAHIYPLPNPVYIWCMAWYICICRYSFSKTTIRRLHCNLMRYVTLATFVLPPCDSSATPTLEFIASMVSMRVSYIYAYIFWDSYVNPAANHTFPQGTSRNKRYINAVDDHLPTPVHLRCSSWYLCMLNRVGYMIPAHLTHLTVSSRHAQYCYHLPDA